MIAATKVKPYKRKLRRHGDMIITLYSPGGPEGGKLISGSADSNFRGKLLFEKCLVWDLQKKRIKKKVQLLRPSESEVEELRAEVALAEAPGSDEERTQATSRSDIIDKLFPVILVVLQ